MLAGGTGRIPQLDVLRGLAAMWVVLSHFFPHWQTHLGPAPIVVPNAWGYYAVELFFVISGFVILMSLEKCRTVLDFAVLRFSRLYPAYWASLILATAIGVLLFNDEFWPRGFLVNLTMLQEFFRISHFDVVYWSLTVEIAFYFNVAWLFALGLQRRIVPVVVVWLTLSLLWALWYRDPADETRDWPAMLLALDYAPFFSIGILYYEASRKGWSYSLIALIAAALAVQAVIAGWTGLIVAAVVTTLVGLALHGHLRILVTRPTLALGAISYCLYLVHRNLGYHMLDALHVQGWRPAIAVPTVIGAAVAIATLLTYCVERPISRRIRKTYARGFLARPRATA